MSYRARYSRPASGQAFGGGVGGYGAPAGGGPLSTAFSYDPNSPYGRQQAAIQAAVQEALAKANGTADTFDVPEGDPKVPPGTYREGPNNTIINVTTGVSYPDDDTADAAAAAAKGVGGETQPKGVGAPAGANGSAAGAPGRPDATRAEMRAGEGPEFAARNSRAAFIDSAYRQFLGRAASPAEYSGYTGMTGEQIVGAVRSSQEAKNIAATGKNALGEPFKGDGSPPPPAAQGPGPAYAARGGAGGAETKGGGGAGTGGSATGNVSPVVEKPGSAGAGTEPPPGFVAGVVDGKPVFINPKTREIRNSDGTPFVSAGAGGGNGSSTSEGGGTAETPEQRAARAALEARQRDEAARVAAGAAKPGNMPADFGKPGTDKASGGYSEPPAETSPAGVPSGSTKVGNLAGGRTAWRAPDGSVVVLNPDGTPYGTSSPSTPATGGTGAAAPGDRNVPKPGDFPELGPAALPPTTTPVTTPPPDAFRPIKDQPVTTTPAPSTTPSTSAPNGGTPVSTPVSTPTPPQDPTSGWYVPPGAGTPVSPIDPTAPPFDPNFSPATGTSTPPAPPATSGTDSVSRTEFNAGDTSSSSAVATSTPTTPPPPDYSTTLAALGATSPPDPMATVPDPFAAQLPPLHDPVGTFS